MTPTQASPSPAQPSRPPQRGTWVLGTLTLIFRLLLLGMGAGLAWLIGVAIAQMIPGQVADPPLMERLIQQTEALEDRRQTLWTRFRPRQDTPSSQISAADPPQPLALSPAKQQQAQAELDQLQEELQRLRDRATLLELNLGITPGVDPVDLRLQHLQQRLDPTAMAAVTEEDGQNTLLITLPSDALFEADGAILSASARGILDSIARDLQVYPHAVMQVAAHTNAGGNAAAQRVKSFEQASAVTQHLQQRLDSSYTWITVGYGSTQPLEIGDSAQDASRDRRIEIRITPR